jgi:hypothetical protein
VTLSYVDHVVSNYMGDDGLLMLTALFGLPALLVQLIHLEGTDYVHLWTITELALEERIVYRWRYEGYQGDSRVAWHLAEHPEGTKLTLTHQGWETFPRDNPVFTRESGEAGWRYFIQERLPAFLAKPTT